MGVLGITNAAPGVPRNTLSGKVLTLREAVDEQQEKGEDIGCSDVVDTLLVTRHTGDDLQQTQQIIGRFKPIPVVWSKHGFMARFNLILQVISPLFWLVGPDSTETSVTELDVRDFLKSKL